MAVCNNNIFCITALLAPKQRIRAAVLVLLATNGALASSIATIESTTLAMALKPKNVSALSSALLISGLALLTSCMRSPRFNMGVIASEKRAILSALPATKN